MQRPMKEPSWIGFALEQLNDDRYPAAKEHAQDLVQAALDKNNRATAKLEQMFAPIFAILARRYATAVDKWASKAEFAEDCLSFLLYGLRLSWTTGLEKKAAKNKQPNTYTVAPLAQWIDGDEQSLGRFVWTALDNACKDLAIHGRALEGGANRPLRRL